MLGKVTSRFTSGNHRLPAQRTAVVFALMVMVASIAASIFFAGTLARQAREDYKTALTQRETAIATRLEGMNSDYTQLLLGAASLLRIKGDLNQAEWQQFYAGMRVQAVYPSTLGVGYITRLPAGAVGGFEAAMRSTVPDFTVWPAGERARYDVVTYLQPENSTNKKVLGYDMASEQRRAAAMSLAATNAQVVVSAPVVVAQDIDVKTDTLGIAMYYPVYTTASTPATASERQAALKGFVYVVARPADIVASYAAENPATFTGVNVTLRDTTNGENSLLYSQTASAAPDQSVTSQVVLHNRQWTLNVAGHAGVVASVVVPMAVLTGGSLIGFLGSAIMLRAMLRRLERVERLYVAEVERTKDELLALASHQLRTPASGVKQYIGILTSGIMGDLTPAQQQVAEKAYVVNERQIEIINQLLYVSKMEAGKITIHPKKSNMTAVVRHIIEQLASNAERKQVHIVFKTRQQQYVYGDDQYYPMIIDNLIGNAIKYSLPGGTVTIKLSVRGGMVRLVVTDEGVGIASKDLPNLFRKFTRIENPLSRSEGGSGLGLFLAYQLARAHGGDITVTSTEGGGSTFTLLLPASRVVTEAQVNIVQPQP